jgi:hypothetical protein
MTFERIFRVEAAPNRAVVAQGETGCGVVLYSTGEGMRCLLENGPRLDDVGMDDAPPGIWIWEGGLAGGERAHEGDYNDVYPVGKFREPTEIEWAAIKRGETPWPEVST